MIKIAFTHTNLQQNKYCSFLRRIMNKVQAGASLRNSFRASRKAPEEWAVYCCVRCMCCIPQQNSPDPDTDSRSPVSPLSPSLISLTSTNKPKYYHSLFPPASSLPRSLSNHGKAWLYISAFLGFRLHLALKLRMCIVVLVWLT